MKQPIIIGFYGYSNTGKTTIIIDLIEKLTSEKKRVATIKKSDKQITLDQPGKDTYRHAKAGAETVVLSTPYETNLLIGKKVDDKKIIDAIQKINEYDFIIIEGANNKEIKKIRIDEKTPLKENTIWTYDGDFEKLYKIIKKEV